MLQPLTKLSVLLCYICSFNVLSSQESTYFANIIPVYENPSHELIRYSTEPPTLETRHLEVPLTIPQLVDMALQNNPQTQVAWWNSKRAVAVRNLAKSQYYPEASFCGLVAHGYDYQFVGGGEIVYTDLEAALCLSYLLLDFGERRADCNAAVAALMAAGWQSDWCMQKVIFEALSCTYAYLGSKEKLAAYESSLDDLNKTYEALEELYNRGLRTISDMYTFKAAIAEARMEIIEQKAIVGAALSDLVAILGLPCSRQLEIASLAEPPVDRKLFLDIERLVYKAQRQRSDLQAKYATLVEKEAIRKRVLASYYPKLQFDGDVGIQHYIRDKAKGLNYNLSLTFNIPFYTGGEARSRQDIALADLEAARIDIEQLKLNITKEITACSLKFESSQELMDEVISYLRNAQQAFDGVFERYKAGTNSMFDLMAAQKQLVRARIRRGEAKSSWYRDFAALVFAIGVIVQGGEGCTDRF